MLPYIKFNTRKHLPVHWRLIPSAWFQKMEPIRIPLLDLQNLAKWYDLSSKQMILKHISSVASLFLKWYSNILNTPLVPPPPIPFPGLKICIVGRSLMGGQSLSHRARFSFLVQQLAWLRSTENNHVTDRCLPLAQPWPTHSRNQSISSPFPTPC